MLIEHMCSVLEILGFVNGSGLSGVQDVVDVLQEGLLRKRAISNLGIWGVPKVLGRCKKI